MIYWYSGDKCGIFISYQEPYRDAGGVDLCPRTKGVFVTKNIQFGIDTMVRIEFISGTQLLLEMWRIMLPNDNAQWRIFHVGDHDLVLELLRHHRSDDATGLNQGRWELWWQDFCAQFIMIIINVTSSLESFRIMRSGCSWVRKGEGESRIYYWNLPRFSYTLYNLYVLPFIASKDHNKKVRVVSAVYCEDCKHDRGRHLSLLLLIK